MKQISSIALLAIAFLTGTASVLAQNVVIKANVPFNFTVGEKELPAGEYVITSPRTNLVEIQSTDRRLVVLAAALHSFHESSAGSKLVFVKYDDQYFLRKISCSSRSPINLDLPAWKMEKKARQLEAMRGSSEQTVVAAR